MLSSRLSLLAFVVAFTLIAVPTASAGIFSGTLVSISSSKLVVENAKGTSKSFRLSTSTSFKLDNKTTRPTNIKPGVRVSVFTSSRGTVTKVVARTGTSTPRTRPKPTRSKKSEPATEPIEDASTSDVAQTGWTQFRGPNRDNRSGETGLLSTWSADGPRLLWKANGLGEGYASVSLTDETVYTMGLTGDGEMVHALDLKTGRIKWSKQTGTSYRNGQGNGPRGTPTLDGDRLYALGANGDLACLDATSGDMHWKGNILGEFNGSKISWGISESPLVDGKQLICTPGGRGATMVALDKMTGKTLWKAAVPNNPRAGYASPIAVDVGGVRQYVTFTSSGVVSVRSEDGRFLWADNRAANTTANCSSVVFYKDHIFSSSGYNTGCALVELISRRNETSTKKKYKLSDMQNHHGGLVVVDGYLYGTSRRDLMCIDMLSGEIMWSDRSVGKGSVTYADGHIYLRSERGPMALVKASPERYEEVARFSPPRDRAGRSTWSHPVVTQGRLFLRDMDTLLCYDVKGP